MAPGSSPSLACRMHGISVGQLSTWRKQFRSGELAGFVPISVLANEALPEPAAVPDVTDAVPTTVGVIEVEFPSGVKLRITGDRGSGLAASAVGAAVIGIPGNFRFYPACGVTDMRRGFDSLAAQVQTMLKLDPHDGALYAFRGRRGDLIKILWWDGQGLCLFSKRLERGRFIWPHAKEGSVALTAAQISMLLEGIDWRARVRTWRPETTC